MTGESEGPGAGVVVLAFLAGALVGAATALLLAPRSGADTRKRLAGAAGTAGERARHARDTARDAARAAVAAAGKACEVAMREASPPAP